MKHFITPIVMISAIMLTQMVLLPLYDTYNVPEVLKNKLKIQSKIKWLLILFGFYLLMSFIWIEVVYNFGVPQFIFMTIEGILIGIFVSFVWYNPKELC